MTAKGTQETRSLQYFRSFDWYIIVLVLEFMRNYSHFLYIAEQDLCASQSDPLRVYAYLRKSIL